MTFSEEQIFEYLGDIAFDAAAGNSAKQVAKTAQSDHPDISEYIGAQNLEEFIINFIGALDMQHTLKTAHRYEKKLYKKFPDLKYDIEVFIESYSDMDLDDEEAFDFATFWKRS